MQRYTLSSMAAVAALLACGQAGAAEPKTVPETRPDIKKALEELKKQKARLPLPPLTDEEKEKAGKRSIANNGRMRALYLPAELRGGGGEFGRGKTDES